MLTTDGMSMKDGGNVELLLTLDGFEAVLTIEAENNFIFQGTSGTGEPSKWRKFSLLKLKRLQVLMTLTIPKGVLMVTKH